MVAAEITFAVGNSPTGARSLCDNKSSGQAGRTEPQITFYEISIGPLLTADCTVQEPLVNTIFSAPLKLFSRPSVGTRQL